MTHNFKRIKKHKLQNKTKNGHTAQRFACQRKIRHVPFRAAVATLLNRAWSLSAVYCVQHMPFLTKPHLLPGSFTPGRPGHSHKAFVSDTGCHRSRLQERGAGRTGRPGIASRETSVARCSRLDAGEPPRPVSAVTSPISHRQ